MVEARYPYYPTIYRNVNPYLSKTRYHGNSFRPLYATLPYIKSSPPTPTSFETTFAPTSPPTTTIIETETSISSNKPFDEVITALPEVGNEIVVQASLNIEVENKTNICGTGKIFQGGSCIESIPNKDSNDEKYIEDSKKSIRDGQSKIPTTSHEDEDIQDNKNTEKTTLEAKSGVVEANKQ